VLATGRRRHRFLEGLAGEFLAHLPLGGGLNAAGGQAPARGPQPGVQGPDAAGEGGGDHHDGWEIHGLFVLSDLQHGEERLLGDLHRAHLFHAFLAGLLFLEPTCFMRFLPAFCFSNSLRLRVTSPP